jgi:hypothetical protein
MSLKSIRTKIASETGYHPDTSDDDKIYLNAQINDSLENLYNSTDLVGSLYEVIVFFDLDTKLVSLPHYVGNVRGCRYYDSPYLVTLRDIRPRFATDAYGIQLTDFREIGQSTLGVQLTEWSKITFSLPEGEVAEKDITIAVIGETPIASRVEEQIIIHEGENTATTTNNWREAPKVIQKNDVCAMDIFITDVNGRDLGVLPNYLLSPRYLIWQIRDDNMVGQTTINSIEVLYKEKLRPLVNDYDEFLFGKYDDIIAWQFLELYWTKQEGKKELADAARDQWSVGLIDINRSNSVGKKAEAQFVPNKFYGLFNTSYNRTKIYGN